MHADGDLALLATVRQRNNRTGNRNKLRTDKVGGIVVQLLLRQSTTGDAKLKNGHTRCGEVNDLRRKNTRRQLTQQILGCRRHLSICCIKAGARLQKHLYDHRTVVRRRLDMLNVVDESRERLFVWSCKTPFKLLRV